MDQAITAMAIDQAITAMAIDQAITAMGIGRTTHPTATTNPTATTGGLILALASTAATSGGLITATTQGGLIITGWLPRPLVTSATRQAVLVTSPRPVASPGGPGRLRDPPCVICALG